MARNVLTDIVDALHRLETQLENQGSRLETIEHSVHSSLRSPSQAASSVQSASLSPISGKPLPECPSASSQTSYSQPSPASLYNASILELRRRFAFRDDSDEYSNEDSASELTDQESCRSSGLDICDAPDTDTFRNHEVYSVSAYTPQQLSRLDLNTPPIPPLPASVKSINVYQQRDDTSALSSLHTNEAVASRAWTGSSCSSGSTNKSKSSTKSQESHERVAIAFYVYENFVMSLRSSMSLRSDERKMSREESRRLQELTAPDPGCETTPEVQDRLKSIVLRVRDVLTRMGQRGYNRGSFRATNVVV